MALAILLAAWISVSVLACRWPKRFHWLGFGLLPLTLLYTHPWRSLIWVWQEDEPLHIAGIDSAYPSLWALVLIPILRRDLSFSALRASLLSGLVAAAAFGLAVDALPWVLVGLKGLVAERVLEGLIHAALFAAGWGLRLYLNRPPAAFPWEYPAWYLGLMTIAQETFPSA
ncbi:hypothetical protein GWK36_02560 [Caldichromatium japonicum]|uniref:Uncharacterized protein n=1 Tax=Caldichromatium japonicum TaxID=2699430 RepID=A0A6G7VB97_9GAMM|nr:hypothetical protein [Caldichromatium japonicum]QIK37067.1 hypothetical protein GWK36_02560 [Caldichromatium japonicum]